MSKLNHYTASYIRNEYVTNPVTYECLAEKYKVSKVSIHRVLVNISYYDPNYKPVRQCIISPKQRVILLPLSDKPKFKRREIINKNTFYSMLYKGLIELVTKSTIGIQSRDTYRVTNKAKVLLDRPEVLPTTYVRARTPV